MRVGFIILLLITFLTPINADDKTTKDPKVTITLNGITYVQEVSPTLRVPLNKNIFFIFDCSGSMNTNKIREAMNFLIAITTQPVDDMQFAVLAFDEPKLSSTTKHGLYRWPGKPEPDLPYPILPGWAGLPSKIAVDEVVVWIKETRSNTGGDTYVAPAIRNALIEDRNEMSIVIISDGEFHDGNGTIMSILEKSLKIRSNNEKLDYVPIMVYGTGSRKNILVQLAQKGGGGYFRKQESKK
jgi:hypothetical protein